MTIQKQIGIQGCCLKQSMVQLSKFITNWILGQKMLLVGFHEQQDPMSDEMNLYFEENKEAIGFNIDNDIFLQLDPDTDEVIGLTILNFKHRIIDKKEEIQLPVSGKFIANQNIFEHETAANI